MATTEANVFQTDPLCKPQLMLHILFFVKISMHQSTDYGNAEGHSQPLELRYGIETGKVEGLSGLRRDSKS